MRVFIYRANAAIFALAALVVAVDLGMRVSVPITIPPYVVGTVAGIAIFVVTAATFSVVTTTFWDMVFSQSRRLLLLDGMKEYWGIIASMSIVIGLGAGWYAGVYFILPGMIGGYLLISFGFYWDAATLLGDLADIFDQDDKTPEKPL